MQKYPYDYSIDKMVRKPMRSARKPHYLRIALFAGMLALIVCGVVVTNKWWNVWQQNISSLFIPDAPLELFLPTPTPAATLAPTATPVPTTPSSAAAALPIVTPSPTPAPVYINDEWNYMDENITIKVVPVDTKDVQYFVADIQVSDAQYFKTALANGGLGKEHQKTSVQAKNNHAILAISGDYCGFDSGGVIIRNGELLRNKKENGDMCLLYQDGRLEIIDAAKADGEQLVADGVVHAWTFGPWLVKDSQMRTDWTGQTLKTYNPRSVVGMISPLHYVFVVIDGRSKASKGMTLQQVAQVMADMGCKVAYNLDGGGTATMIFRDRLINRPLGKQAERSISDILYIGTGQPVPALE